MAIKQLRDGSSRSLLAGASYLNSPDTMHALSYGKRRKAMASLAMLFVYSLLFSIFRTCTAQDTIEPSQAIRDSETMVSAGGTFELGFFSPAKLSTRYLGLWYRNVTPQTVIWVANREMPLSGASGAVNFTNQGFLVLVNGANRVVWTSNVSRTAKDPVAQLLDSGNLVVKDRNDDDPDNYLWQSFDYLCDTLLPGMKLGTNFVTGVERYLSSWKSAEDPAPGRSVHIDTHGYPQVVNKKGSRIQFRLGSWNGITWTGTPYLKPSSTFTMEFEFNEKEVFFKYGSQNGSALTRYTVYSSGIIQCYTWDDQSRDWMVVATAEADECENYALCGAYGSCNIDSSPICSCLDGFIPKSPREWNSTDWSGGCVRGTQLDCDGGDEFLKLSGMKLPDTSSSWFNRSISLEECKGLCLSNCSCTAYANLDIRGTGCLLWYGELFDMRLLKDGGQDIYVRLASSEVDSIQKIRSSSQNQKDRIIAGFVVLVLVFVMLVTGMFLYLHRKIIRKPASAMAKKSSLKNAYNGDRKENMEMPIFDLATIADATDNFSNSNRLGEGGFGPVYKGILEGHDVAVKRLSKRSGQGLNEFKNEAVLIAKLQHRNLVRLLGCCIHEDEKMLIYEYMPNRSLDFFIFDKMGRKLLDWHKCIHIIGGIARGLLYLHQDSRLRIIHRDVKASNILLDGNMNPKISDFGLARTFGADQTEANTNTVVGTYGYMSPEYAVDGLFSMKSDVFSFGVLVLEIVSGKKNRGFCHADHDLNLLGHAWMLWTRGTPMELIDESLVDSCTASEVIRCIHVALLCVQQRPEDRPTMSTVVLMLGSENPLTEPKQPGFFMGRCRPEANSSSSKNALSSPNEITITVLEPR